MAKKELTGVDVELLTEYVVNSRAEGTLKQYRTSLRRVWCHGRKIKSMVFKWTEGEVCGMIISLVEEGCSENIVKQALAVVAMIFEAMGQTSPTRSALVGQVKKAAAKKRPVGKLRPRMVMTLGHLIELVGNLYKKPAQLVKAVDRRTLVLQIILFLGMKRFSDVQMIKVKDVKFREDGSVEISIGKTKTDQAARGSKFVIVGSKKRKVMSADIFRWYFQSLNLKQGDFVFPKLRGGAQSEVAVRSEAVSYRVALQDLQEVCRRYALPPLTLHSARIGAATEGAKAGVSREFLKACGGWSSGAVDDYVRLRDPGIVFNQAVFRHV